MLKPLWLYSNLNDYVMWKMRRPCVPHEGGAKLQLHQTNGIRRAGILFQINDTARTDIFYHDPWSQRPPKTTKTSLRCRIGAERNCTGVSRPPWERSNRQVTSTGLMVSERVELLFI